MNREETIALCLRDEETVKVSRDFDNLLYSGRMDTQDPPWDYKRVALSRMQGVNLMLEIGAGTGEFLSSLPKLPLHTHATESNPSYIDVARMRLSQRGVRIYPAQDGGELPFENSTFQMILNYHKQYAPEEVFRVLRPGGVFMTEQIRGDNGLELNQLLKLKRNGPFAHINLTNAKKTLETLGMIILDARESTMYTRFFDAGAVAYYAHMCPDELPGFTVDKYADDLWDLQRRIEGQGYVTCRTTRFLLIARKDEA